jgi:DNA-binding transcriptional regulator YbjK
MTLDELTTLIALIGSAAMLYLAWKKAPHENRASDADADEHKANATASALASTEIATKQLYATQVELYKERDARKALEVKVQELENMMIGQKADFEKTIRHQKADFELIIGKQNVKIMMLSNQVVQLGGTPITND